jgi:aspartyl-tRNA(Asn)/glutamyl-tRNA(Gln) amidotransferase subunit C
MQVDDATVRRIARLARIKIDDGEVKGLKAELNGILTWVEQLGEVDVEGVEPMTRVVDMKLRWRADEVTDGGIADSVTANAPVSADQFFVVPKVVE